MACSDPDCTEANPGDFYCRECGEMTHAGCRCSCCRVDVVCPSCSHRFSASLR